MVDIKILPDLLHFAAYRFAAFNTAPGRVHTIHQIILWRIAQNGFKVLISVAALPCRPEALCFMVRPAFSSHFAIAFAEDGVIHAHVYFKLVGCGCVYCAEAESVPKQPFGLPGL